MPFLFPEAAANNALRIHKNNKKLLLMPNYNYMYMPRIPHDMRPHEEPIKNSLEAFNYYCRKYLGLGFILSFIPGTEAYQTRIILSEEVDIFSKRLALTLKKKRQDIKITADSYTLKGAIGTIIALLFKTVASIIKPYEETPRIYNLKASLKELLLEFPLLCNIFHINRDRKVRLKDNIIENLLHTLCNPVRLLSDFLFFLQRILNTIIEIGSIENEKSGSVRRVLKNFIGELFTLINIPLQLASRVADIPYQILKNIIYRPLKFIGSSLIQLVKNEHNLLAKNTELDALANLPHAEIDENLGMDKECLRLSNDYVLIKATSTDALSKMKKCLDISRKNIPDKEKVREINQVLDIRVRETPKYSTAAVGRGMPPISGHENKAVIIQLPAEELGHNPSPSQAATYTDIAQTPSPRGASLRQSI